MFELLTNANVYAPESLGIKQILCCAGKIVYIGDKTPQLDDSLEVSITGDIEPGAELHVELEPSGGGSPETIRLWVGEESGAGSLKAKADAHGDHLDGHVEVPDELASGAKLWLQVESSSGASETKGLDLP